MRKYSTTVLRGFAVGGSGNSFAKKNRGSPVKGWRRRRRSVSRLSVRCLEPALIFVFVFLLASPVAMESPSIATLKARRAQQVVDQLRTALGISSEVQIAVVIFHPLVFSVEPMHPQKDRFLLSMELGFLLMLKDDELRAALAHELGHVWIYTHHPFLQTERMANVIGERVADRAALEIVSLKLWAYEGASGVPIDDLLGPTLVESKIPSQP